MQAVVAVAMLAAAGGAWWFFYFAQPQAGGAAPAAANIAVPVETAPVQVGPIQRRLTAVAGRIADIRFNEGEQVIKDQALVVLDNSIYRAELEDAQASIELSQANYDRAIDLLKRSAGTTKARDEALAELRRAEAALELAKARFDKTVIKAPFDAVAGLRKISVGDFVDVGQDMVNLEQIDPLKVDFRVAEVYVGAVRPGQQLQLGVDAFAGEQFAGEVYAIDPLIDESGRSILLRARAGVDAARPGSVRVQGGRRQGGTDEGRGRDPPRRHGRDRLGARARRSGGDRGPAQDQGWRRDQSGAQSGGLNPWSCPISRSGGRYSRP